MDNHQRELLIMLAEEAGELVQACTKALRHGLDNYHPDTPDKTNLKALQHEMADIQAVASLLNSAGVMVKPSSQEVYSALRKKRIWMRTSPKTT